MSDEERAAHVPTLDPKRAGTGGIDRLLPGSRAVSNNIATGRPNSQDAWPEHGHEGNATHPAGMNPDRASGPDLVVHARIEPTSLEGTDDREGLIATVCFAPNDAHDHLAGRYCLLRKIGRGGMGTVHSAYDTLLARHVAVKVLNTGLAQKRKIKITREAQALAQLEHDNVVRIYDVVVASEQPPFIAMELLEGNSLRTWQDTQNSWKDVLRVYIQLGRGLAAAHRAGLVHRDFKPENCIVDPPKLAKVLDFGLAIPNTAPTSARRDTLSQTTPLAGLGQRAGTFGYEPPELIEGKTTDARSDQFSFCIALYEAAYRQPPFRGTTRAALYESIRRERILDAPADLVIPRRLRKIIAQGLALNPESRWPSMEDLLGELERLVEPTKRRWLALGTGIGLAAIGVGVGIREYVRVAKRCSGAEEQLANVWDSRRRKNVEESILGTELSYAQDTWLRVEQQLDAYATTWSSKHVEVCEATAVRQEQSPEALDLRMNCLHERRNALRATAKVLASADETIVRRALDTIEALPAIAQCDNVPQLAAQQQAGSSRSLLDTDEARKTREQLANVKALQFAGKYALALEQVKPIVQEAKEMDHMPLVAEALFHRGWLRQQMGAYSEAVDDLEEAYAIAVEFGNDIIASEASRTLTFVIGYRQRRPIEGFQWGRTALPLAKHTGDPVRIAASLGNTASVLVGEGRYEEAEHQNRRALELKEGALGVDGLRVAAATTSLANSLYWQGKFDEAELHYRKALQIRTSRLGTRHPKVAASMESLAGALVRMGKFHEAENLFRQGLQITRNAVGPSNIEVARSMDNFGVFLNRSGNYEKAEKLHREALQVFTEVLGPDDVDLATTWNNLGDVLEKRGMHRKAEESHRKALELYQNQLGAGHVRATDSMTGIGIALYRQGRHNEAEAEFRNALKIRTDELGPTHHQTIESMNNLASLLIGQGKHSAAETQLRHSLGQLEISAGSSDLGLAEIINNLGLALHGQKKFREAEVQHRKALEIEEHVLGPDHPDVAASASNLGLSLAGQELYQAAEREFRKSERIYKSALGDMHPMLAFPLVGLANVQLEQHEVGAAEGSAARAISILEEDGGNPDKLAEARFVLARAIWDQPGGRKRARELAQSAAEHYTTREPAWINEAEAISEWLDQKRGF